VGVRGGKFHLFVVDFHYSAVRFCAEAQTNFLLFSYAIKVVFASSMLFVFRGKSLFTYLFFPVEWSMKEMALIVQIVSRK